MVKSSPQVESLIKTLVIPPPKSPDMETSSFGLSFSEIVGILHDMCEQEAIPAKFLLQRI